MLKTSAVAVAVRSAGEKAEKFENIYVLAPLYSIKVSFVLSKMLL